MTAPADQNLSADRDDGEAPSDAGRDEGTFNAFLDALTGPGLKLWNAVEETDVRFTTNFKRPGFKGTAIDGAYSVKKLSDQLGAWGFRWGWEVKSERLDTFGVGEEAKTIHSLILRLWFVQPDGSVRYVEHAGATTAAYWSRGDKPGEKPRFIVIEDYAKMSITDAAGKAMAQLGVNADVYLGRFDSSKQVRFRQEEARHANGAEGEANAGLVKHGRSILAELRKVIDEAGLREAAAKFKAPFGSADQPFWPQIIHADRELAVELQQEAKAKAKALDVDLSKV